MTSIGVGRPVWHRNPWRYLSEWCFHSCCLHWRHLMTRIQCLLWDKSSWRWCTTIILVNGIELKPSNSRFCCWLLGHKIGIIVIVTLVQSFLSNQSLFALRFNNTTSLQVRIIFQVIKHLMSNDYCFLGRSWLCLKFEITRVDRQRHWFVLISKVMALSHPCDVEWLVLLSNWLSPLDATWHIMSWIVYGRLYGLAFPPLSRRTKVTPVLFVLIIINSVRIVLHVSNRFNN